MRNLWDESEAAGFPGDLGQRVYSSRLLGRDPSLVLHGGGNTSVKSVETDVFGASEELLWVKGSGWDLATIEAQGFAPCRLERVARLATLERLSDLEMVRELRAAMTRPDAPTPSVEAILHALLPAKFVDHTHADLVLSVTNTPDGEKRAREVWGDRVVLVPYCMPGFVLARLAARIYPQQAGPGTIGMLLMSHGMFSFGASARESYDRHIELVQAAEEYLKRSRAFAVEWPAPVPAAGPLRLELARLRSEVSTAAGAPFVLRARRDAATLGFARSAEVERVARQGPVTPDHVIRTRRLPLVGRDVAGWSAAYRAEFARLAARSPAPLTMLDAAPRVVLDPGLGLVSAGRSAGEAAVVEEIYLHTIEVIQRAERLGGWRALSEGEIFDVEYWDLEQAKLKRAPALRSLAGEVALVTGAASGIGRAAAEALLARDAAVIGLDRDPAVAGVSGKAAYRGLACDLTDEAAFLAALEEGVLGFGGLDMLVLNAGVFPPSCRIEATSLAAWREVMRVNLDANVLVLREAHPLLKLAPRGGRVVVLGSKNVPAPGPGAAAYSASKAALTQLARVAALEWGQDGIRVNVIHPNAVFDTGIWTPEVLARRAAEYGLTVEEYRRRNLLGVEVKSRDVGELVAEMMGPLFARTTGAQLPIDGGNDRVV